ncbi:MAG: ribonuclease H-like domain-containing protein [Candidatus Odinarchaeota archaeon]
MMDGFFCEKCGSVLSRGTCTNKECSSYPKEQNIDREPVPDHVAILPPGETAQHKQEEVLVIPKQENSTRFFCFSDWRSQKLETLLDFASEIQPRPDYILYAGDDTKRFVQFHTEALLPFISGEHVEISKAKGQKTPDSSFLARYITKLHGGIQTSKKAAKTVVKPPDDSVRKIHSYFNDSGLSYATIADGTVNYYTEEKGRTDLSSDDFTREFPEVKPFLEQLNSPTEFISETSLMTFKHRFTVVFRYSIPEQARFEHELSWQIRKTKITFDEDYRVRKRELRKILEISDATVPAMDVSLLEEFLTENFNIRVLDLGEKYDIKQHFIGLTTYLTVRPDTWIIKLKVKPERLSTFIDRNVFEELAELTGNGLLAVIGNDCHPSHELFITGKNVNNLGFRTLERGNYLFAGLPGAESIKDTLEERTLIEDDTPGGDLGPSIFSREEYRDALQELARPEHDSKIKIILSHPPPYRCLDLAKRFGQRHIGSMAVREIIENDKNVRMVACGHVHLHGGKHDTLNRATVINCSSHDDVTALGNVAVVDVDDETGDITNIYWKQLGSKMQVIWGIGPEKASILEQSGYKSPEDLIADPVQIIYRNINAKIGMKELRKFHCRAEALVSNELKKMGETPSLTIEDLMDGVIVDIETDLNQSDIWCIGALHGGKYTPFFASEAGNKDETLRILGAFNRFLEELAKTESKLQLFCYSMTNFDFRILEQLLQKHGLFSEQYRKLPKTDVFHALHGTVAFPLSDLKLKTVARYLKFPRKSPEDHDGMWASIEYYDVFRPEADIPEEKKRRVKEELLLYNEEDTRMVEFIWKQVFQK